MALFIFIANICAFIYKIIFYMLYESQLTLNEKYFTNYCLEPAYLFCIIIRRIFMCIFPRDKHKFFFSIILRA